MTRPVLSVRDRGHEASAVAKASRRLVPFLMLCYCIAYIDRVNVGFAAITMNHDLGFTPTVFGIGAGIFFLGYFVFEVPSNLALERFGARRSVSRIMVGWGLVAAGTAFATGPVSFYVLRFILGAAEAGFFPGVLFFLTLWFPAAYRGRIVGWFMASIPLSAIIGSPISGFLLGAEGWLGLHGWQWLFIVEGLPAALLGLIVFWYLTDRPEEADWLTKDERASLTARLQTERSEIRSREHGSVFAAVLQPRILALSLAYFGLVTCTNGVGFWLPQIIKSMGLSNVETGFVSAIPAIAGMIGMLTLGRRSDRVGERRLHCGVGFAVGAVGLICSAFTDDPVWRIAAFSLALFGLQGSQPMFWTIPASSLTGAAAAAGLALVNSIGGLAGFFGPAVVGFIKQNTGSYGLGMALLSCFGLAAAILVTIAGRPIVPASGPVER